MNKNPTLSSTLVLYKFFKEKKSIEYSNFSGREYSCIKNVLRWYFVLNCIYSKLSNKKLKPNSIPHLLILCAIYQVRFLQIKNSAISNETLEACDKMKLSGLKKYFYAILKRVEFCEVDLTGNKCFFERTIKENWPEHAEKISLYFHSEPANCITLYRKEAFIEKNRSHPLFKSFYFSTTSFYAVIPENIKASKIPGFKEGDFYIQNPVSLELANFLPKTDRKISILDCCCGVGGKTFILKNHYREMCHLTAADIDSKKIIKLKENIKRLNFGPDKVFSEPLQEIKGKYDLIVLDAPCSASGNIRKSPELKFRINSEELKSLALIQDGLLEESWKKLNKGGFLIYMTCSVIKSENIQRVDKLISKVGDAEVTEQRQYLPNETLNGFFICKIKKLS